MVEHLLEEKFWNLEADMVELEIDREDIHDKMKCYEKMSYHIIIYYLFIVHFPIGMDFPFPGVLMKSIGAAFFDRMPFLTSTTCVGCNMCYVFNVSVTDSFDDRRAQCRLI